MVKRRRVPDAHAYAAVTAILLAFLVALAIIVAWHPQANAVDRAVDDLLRASHESRRFELFKWFGYSGSAPAIALGSVLLAAAAWVWTRDLRLVVLCIVALALALVLELVLKAVIGRTAPGSYGAHVHHSFPSGHVTGASALATVAVIVGFTVFPWRPLRALVVALAATYVAVVSAARVAVGAHYATDVMGGALLGVTVALSLWAVLALVGRSPQPTEGPP